MTTTRHNAGLLGRIAGAFRPQRRSALPRRPREAARLRRAAEREYRRKRLMSILTWVFGIGTVIVVAGVLLFSESVFFERQKPNPPPFGVGHPLGPKLPGMPEAPPRR
ncbi:MAG: hypothetical protein HY057_13375 [Rhodospirillales bacterium]|nr:hypothetical protein [Rhodospirillales bacterium]